MARPKPSTQVDVRFVRSRHNGTAICVKDGREEKSPYSGRMRPLETWVPLKLILNRDEIGNPLDLNPNQKLVITVPEWYATEVGFI